MTIQVTSKAFMQGEPIPDRFALDGVSPAIAWSNLPEGTKELALICDDPDAPTPEPWVHWVIYKIPATLDGLPEAIPPQPRLEKPAQMLQGRNSWTSGQTVGYRGPAPPPGHGVHHYRFTLYALDEPLSLDEGQTEKALKQAMAGHVLASGQLVGTYER